MISYIKQLDQSIEEALSSILSSIEEDEQMLFERLTILIDRFARRKNGTIVGNVENMRLVEQIRKELLSLIVAESVKIKAIPRLAKGFEKVAKLTNTYFAANFASFSEKEALYKEVLLANIQSTSDTLLSGGLNANFTTPVAKILRQHVAGNASLKELTRSLKKEIISTPTIPSRLRRYTKQTASDAIEQFSRNYLETISQDLGLAHFLYAGTSIDDTRDFCRERVGKVYTKSQVESWADLKWSGKSPATSKISIYTYCGGFGCRHRLLPISETVFDSMK